MKYLAIVCLGITFICDIILLRSVKENRKKAIGFFIASAVCIILAILCQI